MPTAKAQPDEVIMVGFDMTDALGADETLEESNSNGTLAVNVYDDLQADVSEDVLKGTVQLSGNTVQVLVGHTEGVYNMQFLMPTSSGQILEEDVTLRIVARR